MAEVIDGILIREVETKNIMTKSSLPVGGYSVAVGTATHSAGGIDMEVLVKSAETRMYLAKEENYRLAGKTRG